MSKVWDWNIEEFLQQAASSAPTPGGGSVGAYVGALGASMVCMVANLTIGKEKYKEFELEVLAVLAEGENSLSILKGCMAEDMDVFTQFMTAYKLPKDTEEEKLARADKIQEVLVSATEAPMKTARESLRVMQLAAKMAPIGNKTAISDIGVAAYLADSAIKSALLSVDINLPQIKDEVYTGKISAEKNQILSAAEVLCKETIPVVEKRL